jgi:hypothetical protein
MKQTIKVIAILFAVAAFSFTLPKHNIVGRWITYETDGSMGYVDFHKDGTFKVTSLEGKIYHQGNFKFSNDVFSINDKEGCGNTYWGTYQLTFFGNDSLTVAVISDSCSGRRQSITGGNPGLKRVKR